MKKFLSLFLILGVFFGCTFAITQTVNETNGINYGYIKNVYQSWALYYLAIDYVQIYTGYDAALARIEDGVIFGDLWTDYNQKYPTSSYTTDKNGARFATKTIRSRLQKYLTKAKRKSLKKVMVKGTDNWISAAQFNKFSENDRMILAPSFDPDWWWGGNYLRNSSPTIRNIPFSPSAKITVEDKTLTLSGLVTWEQHPTQIMGKVFLQNWTIQGFRVEYHP